jgi:hypothetical protein
VRTKSYLRTPDNDPSRSVVEPKQFVNDMNTVQTTNKKALAESILGRLAARLFGGSRQPRSILRNHTNLPVFLAMATGIALMCNFVLKENSVQASRFLGPQANIEEVQALVSRNPQDAALHSRLGELYLQERNFKRAMFHFRESSRLSDLYGD